MKKLLYGTTTLVAAGMLAGGAQAADKIKVGVGGYWYAYVAAGSQDDGAGEPGENRRGHQINREGEIIFTGKTNLDNGVQYGVQVQLEAESSGDIIDETFMWMSGSFGRVNIGSENSASYLMGYGAQAPSHWSAGLNSPGSNFTNNPGRGAFFSTNAQLTSDAEKITYFTPRMSGFQLGVSYTPENGCESGGACGGSYAGFQLDNEAGEHSEVIEIGANYNTKMGGTAIGVSGSWGEGDLETPAAGSEDRSEWTVGLKATMGAITVGGRYRNDDRGVSTGNSDDDVWVVNVRYKEGPWGYGIQMASSKRGGGAAGGDDEWRGIEIGGSYSIGPGIVIPFGFQMHDVSDAANVAAEENEATIVFVGTVLGF